MGSQFATVVVDRHDCVDDHCQYLETVRTVRLRMYVYANYYRAFRQGKDALRESMSERVIHREGWKRDQFGIANPETIP